MKVLITGADGMLGTDLCRVLSPNEEVIPLTIKDLDLTDADSTLETFKGLGPDMVVNTAAMTDVDGCEDNPDLAFAVNATAARNVAVACEQVKAALVHISTDFVFDGEKESPYVESDPTRPLSVYGKSKLAGEKFVRTYCEHHFIVRTAWLYGIAGPKNFVEWVIRQASNGAALRVVTDQRGTPTFTVDLCQQIAVLMKSDAYGLYHATGNGECSRHEWATAILENLGLDSVSAGEMTSAELRQKAIRPRYSALANHELGQHGIDIMRDWQDALSDYLMQRDEKV